MKRPGKHKEAFLEGFNTIGLAGAAALSLALLNPVPLLAAMCFEAAYLLFVPDSKWFEKRLAARYDQEVIERRLKLRDQVFPSLSNSTQARFSRLEMLRDHIGEQQFDGRLVYREVLRKLDYLMEKFLLFASKEVEFESYIRSIRSELVSGPVVPPPLPTKGTKRRTYEGGETEGWIKETVTSITERYSREIQGIERDLSDDSNLHNQAILEKRREVLKRRSEYVVRIAEILVNVGHQLQLMEDTFGLINDEIRARSPEQVLADIDEVVYQTDSLTMTMQDFAPFDTMPLEAGAKKLYDAPHEK